MLRLFLAWRLLLMLFPLLLFGFAVLALTATFRREPRTLGVDSRRLLTRSAVWSVP